MRFIRHNEDALRKESLAKKLLCKNDKTFWKEIKLMNNSNMSLPNVTDGISGSHDIVEICGNRVMRIYSIDQFRRNALHRLPTAVSG